MSSFGCSFWVKFRNIRCSNWGVFYVWLVLKLIIVIWENVMKTIFLFAMIFFFSGCSDIDQMVFLHMETLFDTAKNVSAKEIHLDRTELENTDVVVEGVVETVGEYHTYAVLSDSAARVLIVQTQIPSFDDRIKEEDIGKKIKVLGKVVIKKCGLPTIEAISIVPL